MTSSHKPSTLRQIVVYGDCSVCNAKDGEGCKPIGCLTVSASNDKTKYHIHTDRLALALQAAQS